VQIRLHVSIIDADLAFKANAGTAFAIGLEGG
jgi:hypothetical protein